MGHWLIAVLSGTLVAATPLIYAATGELIAERSGVLNLGVEGMMLIGAVTAFGARVAGYPAVVAVACAAAAAAVASLIFAVLALTLATNQIAAGLALTIVGSGLSAFIGRDFSGESVQAIAPIHVIGLSDLSLVGRLVFGQDPLVYLALALAFASWAFLYRTRAGLVVRSIGESPRAAHALGYPVIRIRYATTVFGGAMAGLGGAYLSVSYTPLWVEDMTAGRGWIALALVVFSSWRPGRLVLGAWLFGGMTVLQLFMQSAGVKFPSEVLSALPYLGTIAALVVISRRSHALHSPAPASLAQPFQPEP